MAAQKLNNIIRYQLSNDVIKDQFTDVVKDIEKKIVDLAHAQMKILDNGLTEALFKTIKAKGFQPSEKHFINTGNSVNYGNGRKYLKIDETNRPNKKYPVLLFHVVVCPIRLPKSYVMAPHHLGVKLPMTPESELLQQDLKDCFTLIKKTQLELNSVLAACKTVDELKDLTTVFNPFIKTPEKATTALIPATALFSINKLKSPKKG